MTVEILRGTAPAILDIEFREIEPGLSREKTKESRRI